jgi:hypothetical protein
VKVSLPEPEVMVKAYGVVEMLLRVLAKDTVPFADELLEFKVTSVNRVVAPP